MKPYNGCPELKIGTLYSEGLRPEEALSRGLRGFTWPRHKDRQQEARKEQEPRKEIRCAGKMEAEASRNRESKNLGEEDGARHSGNGANRVDGSLELALRGRVDVAGHQRLHGGSGYAPQGYERNDGQENPAARGESKTGEAESAEKQATEQAAPFAKMLYRRADEDAGNNGGADPDDSKGEADVALVPGVAIFRVEDIDGLECLVSEIVQSRNDSQAREFSMRAE